MIITNPAKAFINDLMKENNASTLRFTVAGSGCCGPNYAVSLEDAAESDVIKNVNGIKVAIDPHLIDTVKDLTLDYEENENSAGLVVTGGSSCC
ncbi:hypothetical protein J6TS2_24100 [Heyndrickxia sporothermodurans]|nr:hypothetical protein J6TS2_24100 [Heyndrickxia sporothermodurans]